MTNKFTNTGNLHGNQGNSQPNIAFCFFFWKLEMIKHVNSNLIIHNHSSCSISTKDY